MGTEGIPRLDKRRVARSFDAAAGDYDQNAALQNEVGSRLVERLDLMRIDPTRILDIGAGPGRMARLLAGRFAQARVLSLDLAHGMLVQSRRRAPRFFSRHDFVCGDLEALPLPDACADLVYSNLALQWCNDLDAACGEMARVLRPGGLVLFTTLGPDTLRELRASWAAADAHVHVNDFIDMHDVGDALIRAGLAEPVMDVEYFTLTYGHADEVMRELKRLGAHNALARRMRGLTGKGRLQRAREAYEQFRGEDGRLPSTYEVVYGHAWAPTTTKRQKLVQFTP